MRELVCGGEAQERGRVDVQDPRSQLLGSRRKEHKAAQLSICNARTLKVRPSPPDTICAGNCKQKKDQTREKDSCMYAQGPILNRRVRERIRLPNSMSKKHENELL